jgi:hypothetical protein
MSISEFKLQTSCWSEADIALFIYAGIDILTFCYIDPAGLPAGVLKSFATISTARSKRLCPPVASHSL